MGSTTPAGVLTVPLAEPIVLKVWREEEEVEKKRAMGPLTDSLP